MQTELLTALYAYKAWADEELIEQLRSFAELTSEEAATFPIRLLNHIHVVDAIFLAHLTGTAHNFASTNTPITPSIDELDISVRAVNHSLRQYVGSLTLAEANAVLCFTFTDGDAGQMTRLEMLAHLLLHGAYHRGAVGQYLRSYGIQPPRDTFTRYLHLNRDQRPDLTICRAGTASGSSV